MLNDERIELIKGLLKSSEADKLPWRSVEGKSTTFEVPLAEGRVRVEWDRSDDESSYSLDILDSNGTRLESIFDFEVEDIAGFTGNPLYQIYTLAKAKGTGSSELIRKMVKQLPL